MTARSSVSIITVLLALLSGCRHETAAGPPRASGYVEATEVKVASKVPGRVETVKAVEGQRVAVGETLVTIATTDIDLALRQAHAEGEQARAQLALLRAGSRPEDIRQADAQLAAANAERVGAEAELASAKQDEARFTQLVQARAGAEKQRDDAASHRGQAEARLAAAHEKTRAAAAVVDRLKAGARPEEIAAARARVAAADAQIAMLEQNRGEATVAAPAAGVVSARLVEPGELVAAGAPLITIVDLDHAWANVYVEEPLIPGVKVGQPAVVVTDAHDRLTGSVTFISPRAEFTPRNVQTAAERAKLVYRVKVTVDNRGGVLKPGMPVEVELSGAPVR